MINNTLGAANCSTMGLRICYTLCYIFAVRMNVRNAHFCLPLIQGSEHSLSSSQGDSAFLVQSIPNIKVWGTMAATSSLVTLTAFEVNRRDLDTTGCLIHLCAGLCSVLTLSAAIYAWERGLIRGLQNLKRLKGE
jgi:hypothetical protein